MSKDPKPAPKPPAPKPSPVQPINEGRVHTPDQTRGLVHIPPQVQTGKPTTSQSTSQGTTGQPAAELPDLTAGRVVIPPPTIPKGNPTIDKGKSGSD